MEAVLEVFLRSRRDVVSGGARLTVHQPITPCRLSCFATTLNSERWTCAGLFFHNQGERMTPFQHCSWRRRRSGGNSHPLLKTPVTVYKFKPAAEMVSSRNVPKIIV